MLVDAEAQRGLSVTMRLYRGLAPEALPMGERFTVEGLLVARVFPGRLLDGERFAAVLSVEVVGARVLIKPRTKTARRMVRPRPS